MPDKPRLTLSTPIEYAKGVGPIRAAEFRSLGIATRGDLLFHFPRDYHQHNSAAALEKK